MIAAGEMDREIAGRTAQIAEMTNAVTELESHPGHEHLRRFTPTGATAQRWTTIEPAIGQLWIDLASATSMLESAQFDQAVHRIWASLRDAQEFLTTVDQVNARVVAGLAPLLKRLDAVGAPASAEITELLALSATDPLSFTLDEISRRIAEIATAVELQLAERAELDALRTHWSDHVAATLATLTILRDAESQAAQTLSGIKQAVVAGPLPRPADSAAALLTELESLRGPDPARLLHLQRRIDSALHVARHAGALADGLLARRDELAGRLRAYEAKAARLGLAEDPDVLSSWRVASGLLSRRPCDLRAVTRAVADYQRMVAEKRRRTS